MTDKPTPADPGQPEEIRFVDFTAWFLRHIPELQLIYPHADAIRVLVAKMLEDFPRDAVTPNILTQPQFLKADLASDPAFAALERLVTALPDGQLRVTDFPPSLQADAAEAARFDGSRIKILLDFVKTFWPIIKMFFPDLPDLPGLPA